MVDSMRLVSSIYVDRSKSQWVVRDREGNLWIVPLTENAWDHREPFFPTADTELEPVPGHYKSLVGVPF